MNRTRYYDKKIPDAIMARPEANYTMVRNKMLRDVNLSPKAKGILCQLLANESGKWKSYMKTLETMNNCGIDCIKGAIKELEKNGYLLRISYVDKVTKRKKGSFWAYTDVPNNFTLEESLAVLEKNNLELQNNATKEKVVQILNERSETLIMNQKDPQVDFPHMELPHMENPRLKRLNNKKTKEKKGTSCESGGNDINENKKITLSMFEDFWKLYPRKVDKGKAKTKWKAICNKPAKDRPTFETIQMAIQEQKKTDRWKEPKYIPHPTTWLNQERWLDDPAEMNNYSPPLKEKEPPELLFKRYFPEEIIRNAFINKCYYPAKELFDDETDVLERLIGLYIQVNGTQKKKLPKHLRGVMPGAIDIIANFIDWVEDSSWITNMRSSILNMDNKLFDSFRREMAKEDNQERDPITGKSYIRE